MAPTDDATQTAEDEVAARLRVLIASTADRWARRISRAGAIEAKDIVLIAEAFAVEEAKVARWAEQQVRLDESSLRRSLTQLGMNP